ncbi:MAG: UbiA family prenyltransferase [Acidobacteria bacterium]|nr:UbiA family prenyltransferase [Acidobacteriota bacterium]
MRVHGGTLRRVRALYDLVHFPHTAFALPFAFLGAALAAGEWPSGRQTLWILAAMAGARSAAMAFNRIADLRFDRDNPRTAARPLPSGRLSLAAAWIFLAASAALFAASAAMLNRLALVLSPVALAVLFLYSYAKRFTAWTHLLLGLALAGAPLGGWIAVRGRLDPGALLPAAAVLFWVAGFDVIYSCQDVDFDRRHGLHSLPARLGLRRALLLSRLFHGVMFLLLLALVPAVGLGPAWLAGVLLTGGLLLYEHSLVRPDDLSRVNRAFFAVNGWIGFLLLASVLADLRWGG